MPLTDCAIRQLRRTYNNRLRAIDAFVEFISVYDETKHRAQIASRLQALEDTKRDFECTRDKVLTSLDECDEQAIDADGKRFYEHYHNVKGFLSEKRGAEESARPFSNSTMSVTMNTSAKVKLPRIELPSFNGDITQWVTFKDRFTSMVHEVVELSEVMKLQYLLAALKGDALAPFDHVQLIAGNYESTWKALLDRYDDSKILRREYFKALHRLEPMNAATAEELTRVVNECKRLVRGMERLNEPIKHWDTPLTSLVRWKLHSKILIAWEQFSADEKTDTYEKMMELCERQIKMLTSTALDHGSSIITKSGSQGISNHRFGSKSTTHRAWSQGPSDRSLKKAPGTGMACAAQITHHEQVCSYCKNNHELSSCTAFQKLPVAERMRIVQESGTCYRCLKGGHRARWCKTRGSCSKCEGRHHVFICNKESRQSQAVTPNGQPSSAASSSDSGTITATSYGVSKREHMVWLSTAIVLIRGQDGREFPARALLDQGSQANFISERLVQALQLRKRRLEKPLRGIGSVSLMADSVVTAEIRSRVSTYTVYLDYMVLPKVIIDFPPRRVDVRDWKIPDKLLLADPSFSEPDSIDLLIGAEIFVELLNQGQLKLAPHLPMLLNTKLGWVVSGREEIAYKDTNIDVVSCGLFEEGLKQAMERLVMLEGVPEERVQTAEEQAMEDWYLRATSRSSNGRYMVELPKSAQHNAKLGVSGPIALRRLLAVERRMKGNPILRKEYHQFMREYESMGHMARVCSYNEEVGEDEQYYYMPHHAVWKPGSTTTKCKVVFDASCKTSSGYSLNDILLVGPQLQDDILSILLRFRMRNIAMIADVEKMYRQIVVAEEDRKLQRILWRENEDESVGVYELHTVTYGTACAPYLAVRTLIKVFEDYAEEFPRAQKWLNDFYVDDLLGGAENVDEAKVIAEQVSVMLSKAGFRLRKWASNVPEAMCDIPDEDCAQSQEFNVDKEGVSTLGLIWIPKTDQFRIQIPSMDAEKPITKRSVMSDVSRIYDPLGFLDPIKMTAKLTLQNIWAMKDTDGNNWPWDVLLPKSMQVEWKQFIEQLNSLDQIRIPRQPRTDGEWQYHIFCDASEKGYGASVYVRNAESTRATEVTLLMSKSKVASLSKRLTVARLELCGALLASRLYQMLQRANLKKATCYLWTDSLTAWHWINAPHNSWKTFVANRVAKIQELTDGCYWRHVPGVSNPADLVSRGCSPVEFALNTSWWSGPEWLAASEEDWPELPVSKNIMTGEERATALLVASPSTEESFSDRLFARYSTYTKLRRVVGYCLRYLHRLRMRATTEETRQEPVIHLTTDELRKAEVALCRLAQRDQFSEDLKDLRLTGCVPRRSVLWGCTPYVDPEGTIRVNGRLRNAEMDKALKYPIVIPKEHQLARLLVTHYHVNLLHAGPQLILTALRQRFWLLGARSTVRKIHRQCVQCFKCKPTMTVQPMGDLPAARVREARPFSVSGVDYCGPVYIKGSSRKSSPTKAYIAVFVCFVTRAVHLELVSNLSTTAFIAALRRFVSRRGLVAELHSDNGTNFKGAANELKSLYELLKSFAFQEQVHTWSNEQGLKWKFIPPGSPHFGGLWEAAVRSMKRHLRRVIGDNSVSYEDMTTLLMQVEACLNSRPITPMSDDPSDLEVLTPGHFLTGSNMQQLPDVDLRSIPENRLNHSVAGETSTRVVVFPS